MWKVYGVQSPIWGYITNRTTRELAATPALRIKDFVAPRIEPEIIFGLKAAPLPGMSEAALLDCIEWVAFGYEVVQSIFPGWKFAAPDAVAAHCVHGALLIGARHAIAPRKTEWQHELASFTVELYCNGKLSQRGSGALVLDSPLLALRSLVELLANDTHNQPLRAGEIISTGTLTLAMPVNAGESGLRKSPAFHSKRSLFDSNSPTTNPPGRYATRTKMRAIPAGRQKIEASPRTLALCHRG